MWHKIKNNAKKVPSTLVLPWVKMLSTSSCICYMQLICLSDVVMLCNVTLKAVVCKRFDVFQLRQECSLGELMDHESCMVKQIRSLDSDMQTLVYENYNKFISATGQ